MRRPSKNLKLALLLLGLLTLVVVFCFTQFYTIELKGPAYEGHDWGLRPSRAGDLALVWSHCFRSRMHAGDLDLLESRDPGRGVQYFVRRIDQPPDARTKRFSWIEYRQADPRELVYQPGTNVFMRGRVLCLVRMPGDSLRP